MNLPSSPSDDASLVKRCQQGDRAALDDLVRKYQQRAYQFAYRLTGDAELAADLTSEAFLRAYLNISRFRGESLFSTWLFRILTNCFLDQAKKEKIRKHQSLEDIVTTEEGDVQRQYESPVETPGDAAERQERTRALKRAILKLPEYQRAIIVMYHVEMMSYEQIAEALALPVGTVKSRLNRARLALRALLDPVAELFSR